MKISLIGAAGQVGQNLALLLKTNLPENTELALNDISPSLPGVAMDLSHINNNVKVTYGDLESTLEGTDLIIITAGKARQPGMDRSELLDQNAYILKQILFTISKKLKNKFPFIAIVTNPVNSLVPMAVKILEKSQFPSSRIFGVTTLDIIRAKQITSETLNLPLKHCNEIKVIGGHSDTTILPLLSSIEDRILPRSINEKERDLIISTVRKAGTMVVKNKMNFGSATLSMAYAGMTFIMEILGAIQNEVVQTCAYTKASDYIKEDWGIEYFAQPFKLSPCGIDYDQINMSCYEKCLMQEISEKIKEDIEKGIKLSYA